MPEREPITEDEIIDKLSSWVVRKRLTTPAILFLETHRHLNFFGSQIVVFFQPVLTVLFDQAGIEAVVAAMERRENVERLLVAIEQKDQEAQTREKAEKAARLEARKAKRERKKAERLARKMAKKAERDTI
jgi:hypothetical protein